MGADLKKASFESEKATSILKSVQVTMEMVKTIDHAKFPSNVIIQYYDVIRQLMTAISTIDRFKPHGEGAHRQLVDYIKSKCPEVTQEEIEFIDRLRILRNDIEYDGFFIDKDYLGRKLVLIKNIIDKLERIVTARL